MTSEILQEAKDNLEMLKEENDFSKRCKEKTTKVISLLDSNCELFIEKALMELEDLNNVEMPSYHRTQVWDVISLLESIKN